MLVNEFTEYIQVKQWDYYLLLMMGDVWAIPAAAFMICESVTGLSSAGQRIALYRTLNWCWLCNHMYAVIKVYVHGNNISCLHKSCGFVYTFLEDGKCTCMLVCKY